MDCPAESGHDLVDGYVAGILSEPEQDAFEQHYFTCARCLADVRVRQDLRDALQPTPAARPLGRTPAGARPWHAAPWFGLALAAGLVAAFGWWWQDRSTRPAAPAVAAVEPQTPPPGASAAQPVEPAPPAPVEAPSRRAVLAQLALVLPPRYVPLAVRGDGPRAGTFDAAMAHYVAGRYRNAATALRELGKAQPTDPGIAFFEGVSALAIGRPGPAREGLARAVAADVQPYADEAHFYLAKVYLAEGNTDLARQELQLAIAREAGPDGEAARILAALSRLPK